MHSGLVPPTSEGRVVHYMDTCFNQTETFVYDFVRGCRRYEAWCLANQIEKLVDFEFHRIQGIKASWRRSPHWKLLNLAYGAFFKHQNLLLANTLRKLRPQVIHAHFGPAGYEILPYARRIDTPLLTSFYGYDASSLPRVPGWKEKLQELFSYGTRFLVEGPAMRARLELIGCPSNKLNLMPITISPERYQFRHRILKHNEPLQMLFVGRFVAKKGLPTLLRAVKKAFGTMSNWNLRIIGGGSSEAELRQLVVDLKISDCVHFLGFRNRCEVIQEIDKAHLLAVPSTSAPDGDTEGGAPTILLEAQASGLPILTTTHADIPFVTADCYRPYLADEGSVVALADNLVKLVDDAALWPDFAEHGRQHILLQHGRANFEQLEQLYDAVGGLC